MYKGGMLSLFKRVLPCMFVDGQARENLTEKGHFGSSILNFETVAPLADECAVLADCQMKLQYKLYVQLFIRY